MEIVRRPGIVALAGSLAYLLALSGAGTAAAGAASSASKPIASATLEQCVTAVAQEERSATFAAEMTAVPGTVRMEVRVDLLERQPHEATFHTVSAPGLGSWSVSTPHVKVFKFLDKVTNLTAPAFYRGAVRFRWLGARGRVIKALDLRTARCQEPAPPAASASAPAAATS
jgi:hypothetical protein